MDAAYIALLAFGLSFAFCAAVLAYSAYQPHRLIRRDDLGAVQALHRLPTPRVGGVGVVLTVAALMLALPGLEGQGFRELVFCMLPVLAAGLAEDIGYRISPRGRLLAAGASAMLAVLVLQVWVPPTGLPFLDVLFGHALAMAVITVAWSTGVCHAFNLIDGVNGFASFTGIAIASGISILATQHGEPLIAAVSLAMGGAILGFLVFNWPFGRIFMGDAGAYCIGFLLVWLALLLTWRVPGISPVSVSLMFFWPVADTLLAMVRRHLTRKPISAPDRLHFHQLVYRSLARRWGLQAQPLALNSITGAGLAPFMAIPVIMGVVLHASTGAALVAWIGSFAAFSGAYALTLRRFRGARRKA